MLLSVSYEEVINVDTNKLFSLLTSNVKQVSGEDTLFEGMEYENKQNKIKSKIIKYIEGEAFVVEMVFKGDLYQQHYYFTSKENTTLLKYEEYFYSSSGLRTINFKFTKFVSRKRKLKNTKLMFENIKKESMK